MSNTDLIKPIPRTLQRHVDCLCGIIDHSNGRNEQGRYNGQAFSIRTILIIEAVLTGDERCPIAGSGIKTSLDSTHKQTQLYGIIWIAPAEIIENRDAFDISTNGYQVSQRLIYGVYCHMIRVDLAVERIDAV